jgi:hypothetical protein
LRSGVVAVAEAGGGVERPDGGAEAASGGAPGAHADNDNATAITATIEPRLRWMGDRRTGNSMLRW